MVRKYWIDGKAIKIDFEELPILGEGKEGIVRRYQNYAMKLYKEDRFNSFGFLHKDDLQYLSQFSMSHFPFSKHLIYDKEGRHIGELKEFIKGQKPLSVFTNLTTKENKIEFDSIFHEVKELSDYGIQMGDLCHNYILNDHFQFVDFGKFQVYHGKQIERDYIFLQNLKCINLFFIEHLLLDKFKNKSYYKQMASSIIKQIIELYELQDFYFGDFICDHMQEENIKTIDQFVKIHKREYLPY